MLHAALLGLAALLAPVCNAFYFSNVYYVTAEYRGDGKSWITREWFDATVERARIENSLSQWVMMLPSEGHPYGRLKGIAPITTETHLNTKHCVSYEGSERQPIWRLSSIIPSWDFFQYVGNDTIHGEIVEKHLRPEWITYKGTIVLTLDTYFYIARRELHGKMENVPIMTETIGRDFPQGVYIHYFVHYQDYDTAPIDPITFEIDKDLDCEQRNLGASPHVLKELYDLPFPRGLSKLLNNHRQYDGKEFSMRKRIVERNLKKIEEHNRGNHSYKLSANHLMDRSFEEIAALRGRLPTKGPRKGQQFPYSNAEVEALSAKLPVELDWRSYGAVTPVKNQGHCGSCWAFGAIGAVEGALFLKNNRTKLVTLSEQALMDCSWGFNNLACGGGYEEEAFEYMMKHGIPTNDFYGAYRESAAPCQAYSTPVETTIEAYYNITQNEKALKVALFKHGPISVAIHMCDAEELVLYNGGVFDLPTCKGPLNHVVTLVGYGVLNGKKYWLLKNSWGVIWGAGGYFLVAIEGNVCNVVDEANFVTLK